MNISRSILLALSLLAATCASAQGFLKTYTPSSSAARDLVQTDDGGYFLVGHVDEDSLLFLQRVDAAGQQVWANNLNFNRARAIAVAKAGDGGFVVLTEFYQDVNGYKNVALKLSATGAVVWSTIINNQFLANGLRDIVATADGGFVLAGDTRDAALNFKNWIVKLDADGSILWNKTFGSTFLNTTRLVALPSGDFVVSGGRNSGDFSLAKVNALGNLIWEQTYAKSGYQKAYDLISTTDGGFALLGTNPEPTFGRLEISVLKTDADGTEQWFKNFFPFVWPTEFYFLPIINCFTQDQAGNFYIPVAEFNLNLTLIKLDANGNALWNRETPSDAFAQAIIPTNDGFFAIAGANNPSVSAVLLKLDSEAEIFSNKIRGTVYRDLDFNCNMDAGEVGLPNFTVEARNPSGDVYFKKVAADGTYEIRVPAGSFDLSAKLAFGPGYLYTACDTPQVVVVGTNQVIDNQMIGVEALAECPLLEVEVGSGNLRRCMQTRYTVSYCNYGNLAATNATMQVSIDSTVLQYSDSGLPVASQNGEVFTFNLPNVPPGECGSFYIDFVVKCTAAVGDVVCVEAHAFPDTTCVPPGANWDGSEIEVTGTCENNDVSFRIKNNGTAPMTKTLDYVIIEDHIIYMQGRVQLDAGEDSLIVIPNPGGACYLGKLVNNNNDATIISQPTAVVENCLVDGNLNLALQFETGENNYAVSTYCNDVTGAYDPNDKRGFPLGWNDEHIIERNQDIEYIIRFQNTGNDTAFLVVIRDTLPVATLDPGSIRPIAASHDYTWDVNGAGIVTFTFAGIELPDSNTNLVASQGFVQFRVRQQPNLPDGTLIRNDAAIYFDFNEPVITNEYFHTVGSPLVLATQNPGGTQQLGIQIMPNPFSSEATFVLQQYAPKNEITFRLFDALGKVVREESFSGNTFLFNARNLSAGLYFFRMEENGAVLTTGKVAVSK